MAQSVNSVWRDSIEMGVVPMDLSAVTWIGKYPQSTFTRYPLRSGPVTNGVATVYPAPSLVVGGTEAALWFGDSGDGSIVRIGAAGRISSQIAWPIPARKLISRDLKSALSRDLDEVLTGDDSARVRARFGVGLPLPRAPHFTRFVPSGGTSLWVESFSEDARAPKTYFVLSDAGMWIARLHAPVGANILAVDASHAVVATTDVDGVVRVSVHKISMLATR